MFFHHLFNLFNHRSKYTTPQKANTFAQGSLIVINNKPCQIKTIEETKHINYSFEKTRDISYSFKLKFVAHDIFDGKEYNLHVKADAYCECPYVNHTYYRIIHISAEGLLSLVTENGEVRAPLSLSLAFPPPHELDCPTRATVCGGDCHLDFLTRNIRRLREGKWLNAVVKSAMGTEHVCGIEHRKY